MAADGGAVEGCIFCGIASGAVPADLVYQDASAVAFRDLRPQAPVHCLVVPRAHYGSLDEVPGGAERLLGHLLSLCAVVARERGLAHGYRVVVNTGADGGQTVGHLHLHMLGGRAMTWPPG